MWKISCPLPMSMAGRCVAEHERSECFASFFAEKVNKITNETIVDQNVYNGTRKMTACSQMFMSSNEVESCIKSIKIKNCEGLNRIPQIFKRKSEYHVILLNLLNRMGTSPSCMKQLSRIE